MNLDDAIHEALKQNPQVEEDFKKNNNAANRLIGVVRQLGCMVDPKEVKKRIYEKLGSKFEEKEKKEDQKQFSTPLHWKNIKTGQKISKDFGIINKCPNPNMQDKKTKYKIDEYEWDVHYSVFGPPPYGTHKMFWLKFLEMHVLVRNGKEFKITPKEFIDNNYHNGD